MSLSRSPNAAATVGRATAHATLMLATAGLLAPAAFAQASEQATPASSQIVASEGEPIATDSNSGSASASAVEPGPAPGSTPQDGAMAVAGDLGATAPPAPTPAAADALTAADVPAAGDAETRGDAQDTDEADDTTGFDAPANEGDAPVSVDERTDAELDFDALYGPYNPVADPTLPPPAQLGGAYDPWEPLNRRMHRFNNVVDRKVARPLARTYVKIVPRPLRLGVGNFFSNLGQPVSALNALLQGKPKQAGQALGRFVLNSTLGIGGIFDPASDAKLPNRSEDFGQTLGLWGWKRSRYVELPLFGPRTLRDVFGMVGDAPLSPLRQVDADKIRVPIQGLQLVDIRAQLLSTDSLREGAEDDYALVRDAWTQRRDFQIFGDRMLEGDDSLPEYLREEHNPTVPVDAMPLMPMDGN